MIDTISHYLACFNDAIVWMSVCITFGFRIRKKVPRTIANWWNDTDYFAMIEKTFHEWHIDTDLFNFWIDSTKRLEWTLAYLIVWINLKLNFMRTVFKFITFRIRESIFLSVVISNLIGQIVYSPTSKWKILCKHSTIQAFTSHHQQQITPIQRILTKK